MKKINKKRILILIGLIILILLEIKEFRDSKAEKIINIKANYKDSQELIEDENVTIQAVNEGKDGISITLPELVNEKKVSKYLIANQEIVTKNEEKEENSVNEQKNENTKEFEEKLPGEKIYLTQEEKDKLNIDLVVEYDSLEIEKERLYNKKLALEDKDKEILNVSGYMPLKTEMTVENIDLSTIEKQIESEYPNKKICGNYKIKLLLDGQEYNPQKYEQKLNIEINLSENKEYTILEYKNEKLSKCEKAEAGKGKIIISATETNSYLVLEEANNSDTELLNSENQDDIDVQADEIATGTSESRLEIDDYETDKNYYTGLNYTEDGTKTNSGKYAENKLRKVTINYYGYNYDSVQTDNTPIGTISDTETQNIVTYKKCVPVDSSGNISIQLIDNPFMNRPQKKGFNGWKTNNTNYSNSISTNRNNFVQTLSTNENNIKNSSGEYVIDLYPDWIDANVIFVSSYGSNYNDGKTADTPISNDWNSISSKLNSNKKTCTNASNREANIIVLTNGTLSYSGMTGPNTAYTLTSMYNGINYGSSSTYIDFSSNNGGWGYYDGSSVTLDSDLQLEYLYINSNVSYKNPNATTDGTDDAYPCIYGNMYNLRIGRGILPTSSNTCTLGQVQGGYYNHSSSEFKLVIESGKYYTLQLYRASTGTGTSNSLTANGTLVIGNDFDRKSNNNENLRIYNRMASKTTTATNSPYTANNSKAFAIEMIVKSGTIGVDYFNSQSASDSSDRNYAGIYVGGHGQTGIDKSDRRLIVEGGNIANLIGGLNIDSTDANNYKTYIYVKDGNIMNITGGAGYTHTYGDRIIQVTGGCIKYSISGGSNGVAASTSTNNGQLTGNSLIYIGGDANIGATYTKDSNGNKTITETSKDETLYGVNAGNVCGGANGNSRYAGQTDGSYIILDGKAVIHNNIFGGGNYGIIGSPSGTTGPAIIDLRNESSTFTTNKEYLITNSSTGGKGLKASGTSIADEDISASLIPSDSAKWVFESAGGTNYYIKNASNNEYLYLRVSSSWWGGTTGSLELSTNNKTAFNISGTNSKKMSYYYSSGRRNYTFYISYNNGWTTSTNSNNGNLYLLTYELRKTEETEDADTLVNIKLFGGTVKNNIYGGANRNSIYGTVDIDINAGNVAGVTYGGSNIEGNITGSTLIDISGGQLGMYSDAATHDYYNTDALFGGGLGSSTKVNGRVLININDQSNNLNIYGNVYGGSSLGTISNNVNINIKDSTSNANAISIIGNVFGGGKGNDSTSAIINGNIDINVDGSNLPKCNVFGGSDVNGTINGTINAKIGENNNSTILAVYGGGNKASIGTETKEVKVYLLSNANVTKAFNGGKSADLLSENEDDLTREIYLQGGTVQNIYGGSDSSGTVTVSNVHIESGNANNIYGGNNQGGTTKISKVDIQGGTVQNVYGGGEKAETTISNVTITGGNIQYIFGGGNQAGVTTTNIQTKGGNIENLFGGSNTSGDVNESFVTTNDKDSSSGNDTITIIGTVYGGNNQGGTTNRGTVTVNGGGVQNVYGGGNQAVSNETHVNINGKVGQSVYGGGNQAGINTNTNIYLTNATVENNVYGGGNEGTVTGNTYVYVKDSTLNNSLYAGGNGSTAIVYGNTNLYMHGTKNNVKNSVFGGGNKAETGTEEKNSSTSNVNIVGGTIGNNVYGGANTSVVYGTTKTNIGCDAVKDTSLEIGNIEIGGTIFGGGEANESGSEVYDFSFISVTKGIDIEIDGNRHNKFAIKGSIFGSGNASSTSGESYITIKNYGTSDSPQSNVSIQRATCVTINNSAISLSGATDRTNEYSNVFFSISRVDKMKMVNNSTLYLCNGANLLKELDSIAEINGNEEKGRVTIDTETGENTKNVDNRIYMLEGKNLNIATNEQVTAYGKVQGMLFLGLFTNRMNPSTSTGFYHSGYNNGDTIKNAGTFSSNSYAMAQHMTDHDISIDGFYTNYNEEGKVKTNYIDTTPKDDVYYIWLVGEKMDVTVFEMSLTASKYATLGTYELLLQGFSEPNTKFALTGFSAGLANGISLVDPSEIPSIETNEEKANSVYGLSMKAGNTGWKNKGSTTFLTEDGGKYKGTNDYDGDNSTYTPTLNFCLYHSQNITKKQALGDVRIRLQVLTPIDDLNYKMSYIDINITLSSALYQNDFYEAAITPGQEFGLFTTTETTITKKSAFSTYYSLYIENFSESKYYQNYKDYNRVLVSRDKYNNPYIFPVNTKLTMLDMVTDKYYYYIVTEEDVKQNKYVYNISDFIAMGSNDSNYDEKSACDNYYNKDKDLTYENFIFHVNFADSSLSNDIDQNTLLMELRDTDNQTLLGVLGIQRDTMKYTVYNNKEATIKLSGELTPETLYLGNTLNLNVITNFTQTVVNSKTVYDTQYFEKKLGIKISIYDNNGNRLNSDSLFGVNFELDGKLYYPRIDGTTRICIADKVTDILARLKLNTQNNKTLATGDYKIKIESFGSSDGIYYGLTASGQIELDVRIINSSYGLKITTEDKLKIVDKDTGFTMNGNANFMSKIEYSSGLQNPNIAVSLYRRDYSDIYSERYNLVDFADYVKTYVSPTAREKEYVVSVKPAKEFNVAYVLKDNLVSGTYKLVYKLYDNNTYVGEAYEYIVIK